MDRFGSKAEVAAGPRHVRLVAREQTFLGADGKSGSCQNQTFQGYAFSLALWLLREERKSPLVYFQHF
jgi:hypothetical protein